MRPWIPLACVLATVPVAAGCGRGALALGTGVLVGAAVVEAAHAHDHEREVVVYEPAPVVVMQPAPAARPAEPQGPPPPPPPPPAGRFDEAAAHSSVDSIDLSACKDAGAPVGYGHARITFQPDGHVSKVVIDAPPGLPKAAVYCLGGALVAAVVPTFEGPAVAMPTGYIVK